MTGDQIKRVREALGLTQSKFATWLGVSLGSLQDWEEDRQPPTKRAIRLLQKAEASASKLKDRLGK
jgi:DNA-binding transcriptional regulator YiaG